MLRIVFIILVRVGRIELPSVAWEATILPLNDTRKYKSLKTTQQTYSTTLLLYYS